MLSPALHKAQPCFWILDIDGTLMPSHEVDNQCFWQAIDDCIGGAPETIDLGGFQHVSDSGILQEWMQQQYGRSPGTDEFVKIRGRFLELIQQAHQLNPSAFSPMQGLESWLKKLLEGGQNHIAVATGGWGHTARFKLQVAGLDKFGLPLSSCDESVSRVDIMQDAFKQLSNQLQSEHDCEAIQTIYVGDGLWDFRASQDLGWTFAGIAEGSRAENLLKAGAKYVFCNFDELQASNGFLNRLWTPARQFHA